MSFTRVRVTTLLGAAVALATLSACPAPGPSQPGGKRSGVRPDACGKVDTSPVGRKIYAFLVASAELDRASIELESSVTSACRKMALALEIPTTGTTSELCNRVADTLEKSLEVSVSTEQRIVTRTVPPVCTTEVDFAAKIAAECEASVSADIEVRCTGSCSGTCTGQCDGACSATNADGSCAGTCSGTCRGRCSAGCDGSADVQASAECKAAAEIRADVRTTCTEPKVEVVTENVTVLDASKLDRALRAIKVGLPSLLVAGYKAKIVAKSLVHYGKTVRDLGKAGGKVFAEIGAQGACVAIQLVAAAAASVNIQARIDVSIQVSARVSGSAHVE